jgi:pimeloyl-ACP methyl ester carboxylesterase
MTPHSYRTACIALLLAACQLPTRTEAENVPVKQQRIGDTSLAFVEEGSGPTVLFVHGASGDWRTWDPLRHDVSQRYRFVSLSRRYHYPNAWQDGGQRYTFDQHVEDVAAFARALNSGKVHLVGNSYSGRLVGVLALRYPDLWRSVVLGEPSLVVPASPEGRAAVAAFSNDMAKAAAAAKSGDDRQSAVLVANAASGDSGAFEKRPASWQERWLDNMKTMGPMFGGPPATAVTCEQLKGLRIPALVIRGELTRENFRHGHDALLSCLPQGTESAVVPNATHFWPADNPEAAANALLAFFGRH